MNIKKWNIPKVDKDGAMLLAEECQINPFLALLLVSRGIETPFDAEEFLYPAEGEDDPFVFADMELAVARINRAIEEGETIAVYGDYDCDGVTSTAMVYAYLKKKTENITYYIPSREDEGYGLNTAAIDKLSEKGVTLIITVDNGVAAFDEIAYANEKGIEVVVTDHHHVPEKLPPAYAVVNPHRADCPSGFKDYAGVGVAFKLVSALEGEFESVLEEYGDLLTLGTLADVMPLVKENRFLIKEGLAVLNGTSRVGLQALISAFNLNDKDISSMSALFGIIPCINAAGRMGDPEVALKLLLAENKVEAAEFSERLIAMNKERRTLTEQISAEAFAMIEENREWGYNRVIVIGGEGWFSGVIGIVASKVMERYGKPCIILSINGDTASGSGRAMDGFDLYSAISSSGDLLNRFGGHEQAAGITIDTDKIDDFRTAVNKFAFEHYPVMPVMTLAVTFKIRPSQIDEEKLDLISVLEPMGAGNESPLFGLFQMKLDNITPIGNGKHLRLSISRDGNRLTALKFGTSPEEFPFTCGEVVNLLVTLERNAFRGVVSASVYIKDIRKADIDEEEIISCYRLFDGIMRGERAAVELFCKNPLTRESVGELYRFLRTKNSFRGGVEHLSVHLDSKCPGLVNIRIALEILMEAGLISLKDLGDGFDIKIIPPKEKVNLSETLTAKRLGLGL